MSHRLKAEPLGRCCHRVDEIRCGGKMLAIGLPALRLHDRLLLEALALEQVQPAIRPCIDEQLEIRIERQLVVAGVDRDFGATVAGRLSRGLAER